MKRSKPLRADPAKVADWLRRSRKPLKGRRRRPSTRSTAAYQAAREAAFTRSQGTCEKPGCSGRAMDPHHIFDEQHYSELVDEADNIIWLCRRCHANHTTAHKRLKRAVVCRAERLARTPKMEAYLERTYGPKL